LLAKRRKSHATLAWFLFACILSIGAVLSKNEAVSFPELGSEVPVFLALWNKRWILPMLDLPQIICAASYLDWKTQPDPRNHFDGSKSAAGARLACQSCEPTAEISAFLRRKLFQVFVFQGFPLFSSLACNLPDH